MLLSQYEVYGLRVQSNTELVGLKPCSNEGRAEITIRRHSSLASSLSPSPTFFRTKTLSDGSIQMSAAEVCEATITPRDGLIEWQAGTHDYPEAAQAYVLGTGLSYCLIARGIEPTHGTAIAINGEAVALLGDSGYGISTLAAGFVVAG